MKSKIEYNRDGIGAKLILFLFFLLSLFCSVISFAGNNFLGEDSLKKSFDLNDPRNPNCPCHKYQKLADEEYNKSLGKLVQKVSAKGAILDGRSFANETKLTKKHLNAYIKYKRKKRSKFFNKLVLILGIKHWDIWKRKPNPTACFHWL